MNCKKLLIALICISSPVFAESDKQLLKKIELLQQQTQNLQSQLNSLQRQLATDHKKSVPKQKPQLQQIAKQPRQAVIHTRDKAKKDGVNTTYHSSPVKVHIPETNPEDIRFYPTALVADNRVVTFIAGTPVVGSPYLGARPAFDGSDYIVNISSINRDIRLMQQRRRLYEAYSSIGYPTPPTPIIALSGKAEPIALFNSPFRGNVSTDLNLGSNELDVAAALNSNVEAYISIAYDDSPPEIGPRIDNSSFDLNLGFVNIGNLDKTPFYFTAGQLYVPFGRYASTMISAPLTMTLSRTRTRPFILGYKSQEDTGPFAAVYIYKSDTSYGRSGVGGVNWGYNYRIGNFSGEIGASYISSIADAAGMQNTGSIPGTTFGGFGSFYNGNELVRKTQAVDVHGNIAFDRFNLAAEWVGATQPFRVQDLSFDGRGAKPQALQTELGITFRAFNRPSSIGLGYQWSKEALALNLPQQRFLGIFNISIWKDTVESIEYRHDLDYGLYQFANGAAPIGGFNYDTIGTGRSADTVSLQIGVYF